MRNHKNVDGYFSTVGCPGQKHTLHAHRSCRWSQYKFVSLQGKFPDPLSAGNFPCRLPDPLSAEDHPLDQVCKPKAWLPPSSSIRRLQTRRNHSYSDMEIQLKAFSWHSTPYFTVLRLIALTFPWQKSRRSREAMTTCTYECLCKKVGFECTGPYPRIFPTSLKVFMPSFDLAAASCMTCALNSWICLTKLWAKNWHIFVCKTGRPALQCFCHCNSCQVLITKSLTNSISNENKKRQEICLTGSWHAYFCYGVSMRWKPLHASSHRRLTSFEGWWQSSGTNEQVYGGDAANVAAWPPAQFKYTKGEDALVKYESAANKFRISCGTCGSFINNVLPDGTIVTGIGK
jgi:hypothetical protein